MSPTLYVCIVLFYNTVCMYGPAFVTTTTTCGLRLRLATPPTVRLQKASPEMLKRLPILMLLDPHYRAYSRGNYDLGA